jgi:hypothetical protein
MDMIRTPSGLSRFRVAVPDKPAGARRERKKLAATSARGKPRVRGKSPP